MVVKSVGGNLVAESRRWRYGACDASSKAVPDIINAPANAVAWALAGRT
jgi:hypothetical protein